MKLFTELVFVHMSIYQLESINDFMLFYLSYFWVMFFLIPSQSSSILFPTYPYHYNCRDSLLFVHDCFFGFKNSYFSLTS